MVKIKDFIHSEEQEELLYPSSDGKPMADNTLQFEWIVKIKLNLERITVGKDIFVAGDLLWYPVEGSPRTNKAPDVMVAIGRPKGHRRSYRQWREKHIAPQVVFEILSKSNDSDEMNKKLNFYQKHGVQEYYIYDPDKNIFTIYHQTDKRLSIQPVTEHWTSPLLGIHFHWTDKTLELADPNHQPFVTYLELAEKQGELVDKLRQSWAERKAEQAKFAEELAKKDEVILEKDKEIQALKDLLKQAGLL